MITTFLLHHASVVPVAFWIVVAVSAALGWSLFHFAQRRALLILGGVGLLGALVLTMSPSGSHAFAVCTVQFSMPFEGIDTLANVAMLLPLTLFTALALRRPLPVLAAVSGFSALIEVVQAVVPVLGRSCDTNDWFMNTVGAVLGALLALGTIALDARMRRSSRAPRSRTSRQHR